MKEKKIIEEIQCNWREDRSRYVEEDENWSRRKVRRQGFSKCRDGGW